jgi:tRNA-specific 2-thiouridylase
MWGPGGKDIEMKKRAVVGFSGGKDSTAAAISLKEKGYDVIAITMILGLKKEEEKIKKIENLAKALNIPLRTVDMRDAFKEKVIDYFTHSYAQGRTPNPCVVCNNEIKFKLLMDYALKKEGGDLYATGHYADKIEINGHWFLKEPVDEKKSQIYFLSMIGKERLKQVIFPIAGIRIEEVRQIVDGLPLANKLESQDVCFLQDVNLMDYLKEYIPGKFKEGDILDINGNKIGTHQGAVYFTKGQRRGTRFSSDRKLYVINTDVKNNTITLGENKHLFSESVKIMEPVYWREVKPGDIYKVKVRYLSKFSEAEVTEVSADHIRARFKHPVRAVTPGQIGAFYDNGIIAAAGFII